MRKIGKNHYYSECKQQRCGVGFFFFHPADSRGITSREAYQEFQPSYDIFRRSGVKGCSDHRFCVRAPSQPTLRVSSSTQATLERESPIQVLTEFNVSWLLWSYKNWYCQVHLSWLHSMVGIFLLSVAFSNCYTFIKSFIIGGLLFILFGNWQKH